MWAVSGVCPVKWCIWCFLQSFCLAFTGQGLNFVWYNNSSKLRNTQIYPFVFWFLHLAQLPSFLFIDITHHRRIHNPSPGPQYQFRFCSHSIHPCRVTFSRTTLEPNTSVFPPVTRRWWIWGRHWRGIKPLLMVQWYNTNLEYSGVLGWFSLLVIIDWPWSTNEVGQTY